MGPVALARIAGVISAIVVGFGDWAGCCWPVLATVPATGAGVGVLGLLTLAAGGCWPLGGWRVLCWCWGLRILGAVRRFRKVGPVSSASGQAVAADRGLWDAAARGSG